MLKKFYVQTKKPFFKNVATIATGTIIAQAIMMAFTPLITRLYGPEIYGLQGIFTSVVGFLTVATALGYPIAIVLPKYDNEAIGLAKLSLLITLFTCLITTILLYSLGGKILHILNAEAISNYIYIIPIAMFIMVLRNVQNQFLIRKKAFKITSRYNILTALIINISKLSFGYIQPAAIYLILTNTLGILVGTIFTYFGWQKNKEKINITVNSPQEKNIQLGALAREYKDFPLLRTPQNLINAFSQSLPVFLLASFFGPSASGQYSIVISVMDIPISLIGGSVMSVFYPRISQAINNKENSRKFVINTTLGMAAIGVIPFTAVVIAGPSIFEFVLGTGWSKAGEYAQWLAVWIFFQFINKPAVSAIPALKLQGTLLIYEIFSTGSKILALWLGFMIFNSDIIAIALFSSVGTIAYAWLILWVIKNCK